MASGKFFFDQRNVLVERTIEVVGVLEGARWERRGRVAETQKVIVATKA
jgi:hypothetical protein